jgi:16S rRNA (adenine1518-N6/adenine1519-N6)-dimethyltransferase
MAEKGGQSDLPPLRDVIRAGELSARKSLGQNYLLDLNITGRIARAAGPLQGVCVIEVGPGPGGLTRALLSEGAQKVVAIERDERFRPALEQIQAHFPDRLAVIFNDALEVDYAAVARTHHATRVVANLPYNIATPLLSMWLTQPIWPPWFDRLCLMFQREVAERLIAEPGNKSFGRLSVLAQARSTARILFHLPARVFTPPPKVDSSLVEIRPVTAGVPATAISALERVTAAAFGQRRKMLRSSLRQISPDVTELLRCAGLDETARAEELSVGDFWRLAACLSTR